MENKETINVKLTPQAKQYLFDLMADEDCTVSEIIERIINRQQKDGITGRVIIEDSREKERKKLTWIPKNCYGEYDAKKISCGWCHGVDSCRSYTVNRW